MSSGDYKNGKMQKILSKDTTTTSLRKDIPESEPECDEKLSLDFPDFKPLIGLRDSILRVIKYQFFNMKSFKI